jgi:zinc dependent phospholipase C
MRALRFAAALVGLLTASVPLRGYSVLTHEQVIDLAWKDQLRPLLLQRFPNATPDDLRHAHAFAYGGSLVQDMGYYPFGKKYFSDLLHYVRTGDFVEALLRDSSDINEYAFALGALAHYSSDNMGHPTINRVTAIEFPRLRKKFGDQVTYAENPKAHIQTEFGFDMVQVAKNRYTSDSYHDFIGFQISEPLLDRAFLETYGLKLKDVLGDEDLAIGSFRRAVSKFIPTMTRAALLNRRADIVRETPNFQEKEFLYRLSRTNYEKEWGKGYRRPGLGSRILAFFLRIIPKIGPATALDFKIPSTRSEDMYIKSVNETMDNYHGLLRQTDHDDVNLPNTDFDTGHETAPAEYSLADQTYAHLLNDLAEQNFIDLTPPLRENILAFYSHPNAPLRTKRNNKEWEKNEHNLQELKNWQPPQNVPAAVRPAAPIPPSM